MSDPIAILNGTVTPISQATLSVFDTGFVHGAAVGDMVRTFGHVPFRLGDHIERLQRGINALQIESAPTGGEWEAAVEQVVQHNAGLIPREHDLGIILFATPGWNPTYLPSDADRPSCTWGVHSFPLPFDRMADGMRNGRQLVIPFRRHIPGECLDSTIKWRNRIHWYLADQDARAIDPRSAALLVDFDGHITETSTANFFIVKDGAIRTPRAANTLDGISRRVVFELAGELGIDCDFANLKPEDAYTADEAFLSSTTCCLMPVASIDGHAPGSPIPGSVYMRLMDAWNERVGLHIIGQIMGES